MTYFNKNRTDKNQKPISKVFRNNGFSIVDLHLVGNGVPDLLVSKHGKTALIEVKSQRGKLSEIQQEFHANWKGKIFVVHDEIEAQAVCDKLCLVLVS